MESGEPVQAEATSISQARVGEAVASVALPGLCLFPLFLPGGGSLHHTCFYSSDFLGYVFVFTVYGSAGEEIQFTYLFMVYFSA